MIQHALKWHDAKYFKGQPKSKAIVWAHNSHIGDASVTAHRGHQVNVGQLVRERFGTENTFIIGFSTDHGSVRAAKQWDGPDAAIDLNSSLPDSVGRILHQVSEKHVKDYALLFRPNMCELTSEQSKAKEVLSQSLPQRFIGVLYVKPTERVSHYSDCHMGLQYDAVIHIDHTQALKKVPIQRENPRPGTVDYSKWDHLDDPGESDIDEMY